MFKRLIGERRGNVADDLNVYTGSLEYKEIKFSFVFNGTELSLIPPEDKKDLIHREWIMKPIGKGVYTLGDPLQIDEPYLIGKCNENGKKIIFLTKQGSRIGSRNSVLYVTVLGYIICKYQREEISRMTFCSPEINCIYPVNQAFEYSFDRNSFTTTGVFSLTTLDHTDTSTEKQPFYIDDKEVLVRFSISRSLSSKITESPISLKSAMTFDFEPTTDYAFILKLCRVAKEFIAFLCYRKDVYLPTIELSGPFDEDGYIHCATMYLLTESAESDFETLKKGRYIKQSYISDAVGEILTDVANNTLYTRHFPENYKHGRCIDAARFIMIVTAFEWEFRRSYPKGVTKKASTIEAENTATVAMQELIDSSSGKLKKIYKFLSGLIKSDSLETEINQIGKDYDEAIGNFGKHLYALNKEEFKYSKMGERLAKQRNHFAHGDLDKEFIDESLLDLVYLEYIIYAIQLRYYGIDDDNIRKSINELFGCNYAL